MTEPAILRRARTVRRVRREVKRYCGHFIAHFAVYSTVILGHTRTQLSRPLRNETKPGANETRHRTSVQKNDLNSLCGRENFCKDCATGLSGETQGNAFFSCNLGEIEQSADR